MQGAGQGAGCRAGWRVQGWVLGTGLSRGNRAEFRARDAGIRYKAHNWVQGTGMGTGYRAGYRVEGWEGIGLGGYRAQGWEGTGLRAGQRVQSLEGAALDVRHLVPFWMEGTGLSGYRPHGPRSWLTAVTAPDGNILVMAAY